MSINIGKVVTGGLLAGVLFNIGDFVLNTTLLSADNDALLAKNGVDPASMMTFSGMLPWIVVDLILGLLVVWTYAAIRPRFGPGAGTAVKAALVPVVAITCVLAGFTSMGVFTSGMLLKSVLAGTLNTIIGSIAGAWAYKES